MELYRRLVLVVCICTAVFLAYKASLSPLIMVEPVDFGDRQKKEGTYMGAKVMTPEKKRLSEMPLNDYIHEVTKGRLFEVEGKEWEELFQNAIAAKEGKQVSREWSKRFPSDKYASRVLFFRPDESPMNSLTAHFQASREPIYVSLIAGQQKRDLELQYRAYSNDDFHIGTGLTNYPHPPTSMLYPYRRYSLWIALMGLLIYLLVPRQKKHPQAIQYPLWRIMLGDFGAMRFIVPFFAFPFIITGGSLQAFTVGWPLLLFFWPIFLLGLWALIVSAWFARFSIVFLDDRLILSSHKGEREFLYKDMAFFQPVTFKTPRWLMILSWVAALTAKGSSRIGATGRAVLLSGSEYGSLGIRLKNGSDLYVSLTDLMGTSLFRKPTSFTEALIKAGVEEKKEVREISSLGLETLQLPVRQRKQEDSR